jgi:hypothetical protein
MFFAEAGRIKEPVPTGVSRIKRGQGSAAEIAFTSLEFLLERFVLPLRLFTIQFVTALHFFRRQTREKFREGQSALSNVVTHRDRLGDCLCRLLKSKHRHDAWPLQLQP